MILGKSLSEVAENKSVGQWCAAFDEETKRLKRLTFDEPTWLDYTILKHIFNIDLDNLHMGTVRTYQLNNIACVILAKDYAGLGAKILSKVRYNEIVAESRRLEELGKYGYLLGV